MQQHDRDLDRIDAILEDAEELSNRIRYFQEDESKFVDDRSPEGRIAYDAIMSPVYRIAEDASHLSEEVTAQFPEYPWRDIVGFRNFVAHGYRDIDRTIAWKVAVEDIPELAEVLESYLANDDEGQ